jgi:hypothetical protein
MYSKEGPAGTLGERMAGIDSWVEGHEQLCAQRYQTLADGVAGLKRVGFWALGGVTATFVAVIGWMAVQLWDGYAGRIDRLEHGQFEGRGP